MTKKQRLAERDDLHRKWLRISMNPSSSTCPSCGSDAIKRELLFGDPTEQKGHYSVWCEPCGSGIRGLQVRGPNLRETLGFDASSSEVLLSERCKERQANDKEI